VGLWRVSLRRHYSGQKKVRAESIADKGSEGATEIVREPRKQQLVQEIG